VTAGCGDGVRDAGEECDDGTGNSDTAADACRTTCTQARCGDGVVDAGEGCDDGNMRPNDGCSPTCVAQPFVCGNGIVEGPEECDDGSVVSGDG
jgi:cysteine-rich repeat protein